MSVTIGLLTIGQAPRPDGLAREVAALIPGSRVIENGALDGLAPESLQAMRPMGRDYRLVTLLNDGSSVEIAKQHILPLLQTRISELEAEGADVTLLMCTGTFPRFEHVRPVLTPQAALYGIVCGLAGSGRVGALTPLPSQVPQARLKWVEYGKPDAFVTDADPYGDDPLAAVSRAAHAVREAGADVLFMDCFGYDMQMRAVALAAFGGPVILARSMAARLAAEVAGAGLVGAEA